MPAQPSSPWALVLKRERLENDGNRSIFSAFSPFSVLSLSKHRSSVEARSIHVQGGKIFLIPQKLVQRERNIVTMLVLALI